MEKDLIQLISRVKASRVPGQGKTRWPEDIRRECVRLIHKGYSISELSRQTGIWTGALKDWQQKLSLPNGFSELAISEPHQPADGDRRFTLKFSTGPMIEGLTFADLKFMKDAGLF